MDVCDKVTTEENGGKDAVASMIKRLAHRNANVQLYTLEVSFSVKYLISKMLTNTFPYSLQTLLVRTAESRCIESLLRERSQMPFYASQMIGTHTRQ
jgi:signal transducing adaptor molecule